MIRENVIIVGGGPAGSSCAWKLRRHGIESLVLDRQVFPRHKLCAGWITPDVVRNLEFDPAAYPHGFLTIDRLHCEYFGRRSVRRFIRRTNQFSIRRYEFDHWLLRRSGAAFDRHEVRSVRIEGDEFVIDDRYACRHLVGAGGTYCPVRRELFVGCTPRSPNCQVAALEEEFYYPERREECHLWFRERGLGGYAWHVPKADGWVNVGLGTFRASLPDGPHLRRHWEEFVQKLATIGLVRDHTYRPEGYSYYVWEPGKEVQRGRAYLVGDSAGLATSDLAEGIGPAIESGIRAADAIATGNAYALGGLTRSSLFPSGSWIASLTGWIDRDGRYLRKRLYGLGSTR